MWTLGYDDNGREFGFSQAFHGRRKLRPLVPSPLPPRRANGRNFSSQYYRLADILNEKSKRQLMSSENTSSCPPQVVVSSSRWNPTAEQFRILEELYRRGTRTPSADQIQLITAQLRPHGKIEGKNVFYWFQNHKARERQKRRRQMAAEESKYSETEKGYEIRQTKTNGSWERPTPPPSKTCTTMLSQECAKTQRTTKVVELEEEQGRKKTLRLNGDVESGRRYNVVDDEESKTTTLQLFPLCSTKLCKYDGERAGRQDDRPEIMSDSDMIKSSTLSPRCGFQLFEFLPLKN